MRNPSPKSITLQFNSMSAANLLSHFQIKSPTHCHNISNRLHILTSTQKHHSISNQIKTQYSANHKQINQFQRPSPNTPTTSNPTIVPKHPHHQNITHSTLTKLNIGSLMNSVQLSKTNQTQSKLFNKKTIKSMQNTQRRNANQSIKEKLKKENNFQQNNSEKCKTQNQYDCKLDQKIMLQKDKSWGILCKQNALKEKGKPQHKISENASTLSINSKQQSFLDISEFGLDGGQNKMFDGVRHEGNVNLMEVLECKKKSLYDQICKLDQKILNQEYEKSFTYAICSNAKKDMVHLMKKKCQVHKKIVNHDLDQPKCIPTTKLTINIKRAQI